MVISNPFFTNFYKTMLQKIILLHNNVLNTILILHCEQTFESNRCNTIIYMVCVSVIVCFVLFFIKYIIKPIDCVWSELIGYISKLLGIGRADSFALTYRWYILFIFCWIGIGRRIDLIQFVTLNEMASSPISFNYHCW